MAQDVWQKQYCYKSSLHSKQVCLFVGLLWCQKRVMLWSLTVKIFYLHNNLFPLCCLSQAKLVPQTPRSCIYNYRGLAHVGTVNAARLPPAFSTECGMHRWTSRLIKQVQNVVDFPFKMLDTVDGWWIGLIWEADLAQLVALFSKSVGFVSFYSSICWGWQKKTRPFKEEKKESLDSNVQILSTIKLLYSYNCLHLFPFSSHRSWF